MGEADRQGTEGWTDTKPMHYVYRYRHDQRKKSRTKSREAERKYEGVV